MTGNSILVLGIGNDILMDDGVGLKLIDDLAPRCSAAGVTFEKAVLGGLEILDFVQGFQKVIFIDGVRSDGGVPGTVSLFGPDDFKETLHLSNLHDISFLTALELGKRAGMDLPGEVHIIAVEIFEDRVFGEYLSPPLADRYDDILERVDALVRELIAPAEKVS